MVQERRANFVQALREGHERDALALAASSTYVLARLVEMPDEWRLFGSLLRDIDLAQRAEHLAARTLHVELLAHCLSVQPRRCGPLARCDDCCGRARSSEHCNALLAEVLSSTRVKLGVSDNEAHTAIVARRCVELLLTARAQPNGPCTGGPWLVRLATMGCDEVACACAAALLAAKADVNTCYQDEFVLMWTACATAGPQPGLVRLLLQHGAGCQLDARDHVDHSALMRLAMHGAPHQLQLLLDAKANPNLAMRDGHPEAGGFTALDFAIHWRNWPVLPTLFAAGALSHTSHVLDFGRAREVFVHFLMHHALSLLLDLPCDLQSLIARLASFHDD